MCPRSKNNLLVGLLALSDHTGELELFETRTPRRAGQRPSLG
jgi:hypothetical protein